MLRDEKSVTRTGKKVVRRGRLRGCDPAVMRNAWGSEVLFDDRCDIIAGCGYPGKRDDQAICEQVAAAA